MVFSRLEYWSGYPFPSPGDLPNPGIKPGNRTQELGKSNPGIGSSPALQVNSLPAQWLDQAAAAKHLPKPNFHQKKKKDLQKMVMVTVGWTAVHLNHCSFLNPGETTTSEKYA